jgi:hypothetical protein
MEAVRVKSGAVISGPQLQLEKSPGLKKIDVVRLLDGQNEVCLVHRGMEYRLRVTSQGKLLLTK